MHYLKVEIIIPMFYNDGKKIESSKHAQTFRQIVKQFKGCTEDKSPLLGGWIDQSTGKQYKDKNFSYWVICEDNNTNEDFLNDFKENLKTRYSQQEILMYSFNIKSFTKLV